MFFGIDPSELDVSVAEAWNSIRSLAELPKSGWRLKQLSRREELKQAGITYLMENENGLKLTLKHRLRPNNPDRFAAHFDRQVEAFRRFPRTAEFTVPEPLILDKQSQSSLIHFVDGSPLAQVMRNAFSNRAYQHSLLRAAGAWLDRYHRSNVDEVRNFNPKYTVDYYLELGQKINSGEAEVAAKSLFLKGIDCIQSVAPNFAGRKTVSAIQHGDFHMRNIIISEKNQVAGIDFTKCAFVPVGHDIAKLLLDYTAIMRNANELDPNCIVPEDALDAFFSGYKLVDKDDPSVGYLLYARILATLAQVPKSKQDRKPAKQRTLNRLRPLAKKAFGIL